ncbi:hypothetical protein EUGRSUZ_J01488 [Eucalyptus grandis]|uniref:Uncharacterized protein n=2 Tax=Eucalyptus grandis TaxID=71139 RepID=A0ACC3J792_EUCGR|nr:hypothetical protein EUGRSUZ_J01488 [Eucalyptus grandis]
MGCPLTKLFFPCSSVHQQMQPEEVSDPSTQQQFRLQQNVQTSPINLMQAVQFQPQNYEPNQSTLYSGQPIPVSSQIPAGFQPLHPVPGFTTGPMNAPAQPFHTVGIIVQLPPSTPPSPWTTGLFDCMDDPLIDTLQNRFNLMESPAPDWITHFFCECCALPEGYKELKSRGLDPSIGKTDGNAANMQNVQYQVVMVPPMHQQAMRA